ncbi:MAG: NADH:ubiquinone reductase (Na(+)-transporting) subunit C, partial [Parachlamydiaceae bacterium]
YLNDHRKSGYYKEPWKLFYEIMPNEGAKNEPIGYVIPVNGYGLWDAIYGYIAIAKDANTVIGISWYDQKETPGLGANISEAPWQNLFPGKKIFLSNPDGSTDFKKAPLGITVVNGKVSEVLGDSPKARSAVDGMAGATLTGNGVTDAYKNVLSAYRPLFLKIQASIKNESR